MTPTRTQQRPLLHIGLVKTASTWMQKHLIWNDRHGFQSALDRHALHLTAFRQPTWGYDRAEALRTACEPGLRQAAERNLQAVISHECLAGNPWNGGYLAPELLDALSSAFPDARVLLCLREQRSLAASYYHEYVNAGGTGTLEFFLTPDESDGRAPRPRDEFFHYNQLVRGYLDRFGRENVMVEPYERIRDDPKDFAARLGDWLGVPVKPNELPVDRVRSSKSPLRVALERRANKWLYRHNANQGAPFHHPGARTLLSPIDSLTPSFLQDRLKRREKAKIARWADGLFEASNAEVMAATGIDLARYGYALPEGSATSSASPKPREHVTQGQGG
ncbi:MAG: sulfotransferase domain-containing protein [Planctomycetota bacterium]